jgi:hypothetical protein
MTLIFKPRAPGPTRRWGLIGTSDDSLKTRSVQLGAGSYAFPRAARTNRAAGRGREGRRPGPQPRAVRDPGRVERAGECKDDDGYEEQVRAVYPRGRAGRARSAPDPRRPPVVSPGNVYQCSILIIDRTSGRGRTVRGRAARGSPRSRGPWNVGRGPGRVVWGDDIRAPGRCQGAVPRSGPWFSRTAGLEPPPCDIVHVTSGAAASSDGKEVGTSARVRAPLPRRRMTRLERILS